MYYFLMYLVGVLDTINTISEVFTCILSILVIIMIIGIIAVTDEEKGSYKYVKPDYVPPFKRHKRSIHWLSAIFIITLFLNIIIPSKKEITEIVVAGYVLTNGSEHVEQISNSEIGKKVYELVGVKLDSYIKETKETIEGEN